MKNINKKQALHKGTSLILKNIKDRNLQSYQQADGRYSNNKAKVRYQKGGFSWTWLQCPVQPAFAMTINESQGKTFSRKVRFYLHKNVFSHGQLFVAFARVTDLSNIKVCLPHEEK